MRLPRRLPALAASTVLALGALGCGNKQEEYTEGKTEGVYLTAEDVKYQLQGSRILDPETLVEDRAYFSGLPADVKEPGPGQEWFGVWIRAENETDAVRTPARDFVLVDTLDNEYEPIDLGSGNAFAYEPTPIEPGDTLPPPEAVAAEAGNEGAILVFKIDISAFQNRPLIFKIMSNSLPKEELAQVELDL